MFQISYLTRKIAQYVQSTKFRPIAKEAIILYMTLSFDFVNKSVLNKPPSGASKINKPPHGFSGVFPVLIPIAR